MNKKLYKLMDWAAIEAIEYAEEEKDSHSLSTISSLARENSVYILAGSIPEKEEDKLFNTSYLFDKEGRIIAKHRKMHLFDIDVKGGVNLKKLYSSNALAVFIQPPSIEELRKRLIGRGTDSMEAIERRVAKAEEELTYSDKFDVVLVNDSLEEALATAEKIVEEFASR